MKGVLQMSRSSLILGALFMIVGPLVVFTPQRKLLVHNVVARSLVRGAHKRETRYVSFVLFCLILAAQVRDTSSYAHSITHTHTHKYIYQGKEVVRIWYV